MMRLPHLSVVIPTSNRVGTLEQCLKAVRASTFQDYELIVIDCGSQDATPAIARRYADRVIELDRVSSRSTARNRGVAAAEGEMIVNIDSDVVIRPDTLIRIAAYFSSHPEVDAVTGLLSKEHPHPDFFSQYKNLYMHYMFSQLPECVTFLYGSLYAFRKRAARPSGTLVRVADDTALGQQLAAEGKRIAFIRELEVLHRKRYDAWSLIRNDFRIPFDWARLFLVYNGWRQLGRNGVGFAHARIGQLVSVVIAPLIMLGGLLSLSGVWWLPWTGSLIACWLLLNLRFVAFLEKERGVKFGLLGCAWTFFDHLVMAMGIACGFVTALVSLTRHPARTR